MRLEGAELALAVVLGLGLGIAPGVAQDAVRPSALAGAWYPAGPGELAGTVDGLLAGARPTGPQGLIQALVVPHAGYVYSGETAAAAFALINGGAYRRVLILAPSHHGGFRRLSIAGVDAYETPLGRVPLDGEAVAQLRGSPLVRAEQDAHRSEHAIEIELPFLQRALQPGWGLVPILVGRLDPPDYPAVAALLRPLVDTGTLVVVSSDLTHFGARFGYQPFAPDGQAPERIRALDEGALERIVAKDAAGLLDYEARTGITICGYRPLALLLELLPADARVERVAYATSGDITGDWRHSVSYAALAVTVPAPSEAKDGPGGAATQGLVKGPALERLHRIAVLGVKAGAEGLPAELEAEIAAVSNGLPPGLGDPAGAFVTLWSNGQLRGCVGHVLDDLPLYRAVLESGYRAARLDHRFRPVGPEELAGLEVEVSVLSPLRPVDSIDSIHLGEHGITLRKGDHYGLYLPEVAGHMGWDLDTTLSQLALKAGLPEDAWQDGASFEVFTTTQVRAPYPAEALRRPAATGSALLDR